MRLCPRSLASLALTTTAIALFAACSHSGPKADAPAAAVAAPLALPTTLKEAVDSNFRSPENRSRDQFRHPLETLTFFDIQPEMTVVEITPAGGWYTEILAPYLADKGHYIAAQNAPSDTDEHGKPLKAWMDAHPEVGSKITFTEFKAPDHLEIAPEGSADRVLTFRNVHNWMMGHNQEAVFKAAFKALKPGGMLGVVEHRAGKNAKTNAKTKDGKTGYVSEKEVMAFAKKSRLQIRQKV